MQSTKRTTVAVVRNEIGLGVPEFADLIQKSVPTVKSLESGRLALSEKTARAIADKTGVSVSWLMGNDVTTPPMTALGDNWTKMDFEAIAAKDATEESEFWIHGPRAVRIRMAEALCWEFGYRIFSVLAHTSGDMSKFSIVLHRAEKFTDALQKEFGIDPKVGLLRAKTHSLEVLSQASNAGFSDLLRKETKPIKKKPSQP